MFGSGEEVAAKLSKAWAKLKEFFSSFLDVAVKNFKLLVKTVANLVDFVLTLGSYLGYLFNLITSIFTFDGEGITKAFEGLGAAGEKIVDIFLNIVSYIKDAFLNFLDFVGLKEPLLAFFDAFAQKASAVFKSVMEFMAPVIDGIKFIAGGIANVAGFAKDKLAGGIEAVASFFGGDDEDDKNKLTNNNKPQPTVQPGPITSFLKVDNVSPAAALPNTINNNTNNITSTNSVNVGTISVVSNNADPKQVAKEIPAAMNNYNSYIPANAAVAY